MRATIVVIALACATSIASADVTVYLDRDGAATESGVKIPAYRGGDERWHRLVTCVKRQFAPFEITIVDSRPRVEPYITAVVGGKPSLLGYDDHTTNGIGAYTGELLPNAVVYTFSEVGPGETDVANLCAVTAHEVGHALGLDHEVLCGDLMSYFHDRCGAPRFVDALAPCGENAPRECGIGVVRRQNSYERLGALLGFRIAPDPDTATPDDLADPFAVEDTAGATRMIKAITNARSETVRAAPSS